MYRSWRLRSSTRLSSPYRSMTFSSLAYQSSACSTKRLSACLASGSWLSKGAASSSCAGFAKSNQRDTVGAMATRLSTPLIRVRTKSAGGTISPSALRSNPCSRCSVLASFADRGCRGILITISKGLRHPLRRTVPLDRQTSQWWPLLAINVAGMRRVGIQPMRWSIRSFSRPMPKPYHRLRCNREKTASMPLPVMTSAMASRGSNGSKPMVNALSAPSPNCDTPKRAEAAPAFCG